MHYVIMVVIDPLTHDTVGIKKLKGPEHLLGLRTFPGGKVEEGETAQAAASRELLEEVGLSVDSADWKVFGTKKWPGGQLECLAAFCENVKAARQCEEEPVWIQTIYDAASESVHAGGYVEDFLDLANGATIALRLPMPEPFE